ncbi:MAG: HEAT repeat domain-containing protein [Gemmatimonadetes bacterium]|nr:HEAT repeat domain-containing protein [Gemmatimonadota bacterium]
MRGANVKTLSLVLLFAPLFVAAQPGSGSGQPPRQTQADDYTRYELLAPGSGKFRILYEVTATTPGATQFFNGIRQGSVASDESVFDMMTGNPLRFDEVGQEIARAGGRENADWLLAVAKSPTETVARRRRVINALAKFDDPRVKAALKDLIVK